MKRGGSRGESEPTRTCTIKNKETTMLFRETRLFTSTFNSADVARVALRQRDAVQTPGALLSVVRENIQKRKLVRFERNRDTGWPL